MKTSDGRLKKLGNREYRSEYARATSIAWLVHQIKAMREERELTQEDLGKLMGKSQSAIGRLESERYGNWSTSTLHEFAEAFDVALQIRFVSWPKFLRWSADTSPRKMYVPGFDPNAFSKEAPSRYGSWYSSPHGLENRPAPLVLPGSFWTASYNLGAPFGSPEQQKLAQRVH